MPMGRTTRKTTINTARKCVIAVHRQYACVALVSCRVGSCAPDVTNDSARVRIHSASAPFVCQPARFTRSKRTPRALFLFSVNPVISPSRIAQEPNRAHIVSYERVLEDRMQRRGLNDEAGITHRNGVCHVQFIASVLAGERWEIRLRNIELHQRKLQQSPSCAVDDVPRLRPPSFGWRELERGASNQESVWADGRHQHVVVVAVEIPQREPAIADRHRHDVVLVRSHAIEAGLTCQFVRGQAHGRWWRRAGARRRASVRERPRGRHRPRHSSNRPD